MENEAFRTSDSGPGALEEYRSFVRQLIREEVARAVAEDIRDAAQELSEERKIFIREALEKTVPLWER